MKTPLQIEQQFYKDAEKLRKFLNDTGFYETDCGVKVKTLRQLIADGDLTQHGRRDDAHSS